MTKIGGKGFKAEDVKAMIASKPKLSIAELEALPKIPTQKLALLWKQQIAESYSGVYTLLTKQDEHKLRALADKAGPKTARLIAEAIKDWPSLVHHVKVEAGLQALPMSPRIGFLLFYVGLALGWLDQKTAKPEVQLIAKPKAMPKPMYEGLTYEELLKKTNPDLWEELYGTAS
jgi:hypothetical protein